MNSKICLALDGLPAHQALSLVKVLGPLCYAVKIHDWLDRERGDVVGMLKRLGAQRVWVDYKIKDTGGTAGLRSGALFQQGADIVTVHASGGVEMMQAAVQAAWQYSTNAKVWAITVLTSLGQYEITRIHGYNKDGSERTSTMVAQELALMANEAGVHGLVCSAQEVGALSQDPQLAEMDLVVPGTRSAGAALGQQVRSGTPRQAIIDGATYLVAGSQVTSATDPVAAFKAMEAEIA